MRDHKVNTADILAWYDQNAREMPWRIPPARSVGGELPDPYHIWLSEVMLQQTTVAAVVKYFLTFTEKWPDIHQLANAQDADVMGAWAGLGYYARARNLLKCARIISTEHNGIFPNTEVELLSLPGIGPYTAAAISAIAFGQQATVLDANVERVMARIYAIEEPLPDCKPTLRKYAATLTPPQRAGDYAQAVMDLGATLCSQKPDCAPCPWKLTCKAKQKGIASILPKKRVKSAKPVRQGIAYLAMRADGALLLETRPQKGLLGGMLCLPTSEWIEGEPKANPPVDTKWETSATVKHTFTHFHLYLHVMTAKIPLNCTPARGQIMLASEFDPNTMPTVMRKAYNAGIRKFASQGVET